MPHTILIGDIHGCAHEFSLLLEKIPLTWGTRLVLMGDLVNKGPDPTGVVRLVQYLDCLCLRGNHENDHLKWRAGKHIPKAESVRTKKMMSRRDYAAYLDMAAHMPLFFRNVDFVAVHAALCLGIPLARQAPEILTGEVTLDRTWKDEIDFGRPLVVGHKRYSKNPAKPFIVKNKFYGIDTGCVYGGALTALALPSGKIWQVPARRQYSAR